MVGRVYAGYVAARVCSGVAWWVDYSQNSQLRGRREAAIAELVIYWEDTCSKHIAPPVGLWYIEMWS
jgi:hypothetical protein